MNTILDTIFGKFTRKEIILALEACVRALKAEAKEEPALKQGELPFDKVNEVADMEPFYKPGTLPEPFTKPRDYGFNIAKSGIYVTPTTKRALGYNPRSFSFTTASRTAVYFSDDDTLSYKINPSGRLTKASAMEFCNETPFVKGDFIYLQETANRNIFKIKYGHNHLINA